MPRNIGDIPLDLPLQHYQVLRDMRAAILEMQGSVAPLATPTNLTVTPQGFQNLIQFTRSIDADGYEVRHSQSANISDASTQKVDIGSTAAWTDTVGNVNITKFYWIRAYRHNGLKSPWSPMKSAKTLASGTGVTPPTPPPSGQAIVVDQTTGQRIPSDVKGSVPNL